MLFKTVSEGMPKEKEEGVGYVVTDPDLLFDKSLEFPLDIRSRSGNELWGRNVLSGLCPWCQKNCGFKTNGIRKEGTIPLSCDNCNKNVIYDRWEEIVFPVARLNGVGGLPEEIDKYYQEALSCIAALAPNGAATLFRKLIHQVGIHYEVTTIHENETLVGIIEKLLEEGHINKKLVEALKRVRLLGNDGAHVNENEPDMEQITGIKKLVDSFLMATVLNDKTIQEVDKMRSRDEEKR